MHWKNQPGHPLHSSAWMLHMALEPYASYSGPVIRSRLNGHEVAPSSKLLKFKQQEAETT